MKTYEKELSDNIVFNAKILLKYYLSLKYQFKNIEFWGSAFYQWDSKILELRNIIKKYK